MYLTLILKYFNIISLNYLKFISSYLPEETYESSNVQMIVIQ